MPIKSILLYKLPRGVAPSKADAERIVSVLTDRLCCVQQTDGRSSSSSAHGGGELKQLDAVITILRQNPAQDLSVVANPHSLKEAWLFRLHKEAPSKAFLVLKGMSLPRVTEAEPNIRAFLEKRLEYRQRTQVWIQSYSWSMGDKHSDVTIKLLQVSQGNQSPKVLALELTYHPAVDLAAGGALLAELADRITALVGGPVPGGHQGMLQQLQPNWAQQYELRDTPFGPLHSVVLYNELLAEGLGAR